MTLKRLNPVKQTCMASLLFMAVLLQGCFTGIEYTPKITYKDVKKEKIRVTDEQRIADSFTPDPISGWHTGKKLYVTDPKISLVLNGEYRFAKGDTLIYAGQKRGNTYYGEERVIQLFRSTKYPGDTIESTLAQPVDAVSGISRFPFIIDMDLIAKMRSALVGKTYYLTTSQWYTPEGDMRAGRKFVPVEITAVNPWSEDYTAIVSFSDHSNGVTGCVLMSQNSGNSLRGFDTLFAIENPRKRYPNVTDANWTAIQNSSVNEGMTRQEVQASLGAPSTIDRGHNQSNAYERWIYSDGVSLVFIDGILISK